MGPQMPGQYVVPPNVPVWLVVVVLGLKVVIAGLKPGSINQQPRQPWLGDQRNLGGPKGVSALRCIFKGGGQKGVNCIFKDLD